MTQKIINIGKLPNDGTGDPLRKAFSKVDDNFDELYLAFTPVKKIIAGTQIEIDPPSGIGQVTIWSYDQCDEEFVVDGYQATALPIGNLVVDGGRAYVCSNPSIQAMELTYDTSLAASNEIQLPLYGLVNILIDWGDDNFEYVNTTGNISHTYGSSDIYIVRLFGTLTQFGDASGSVTNAESLISVGSWGTLGLTSLNGAFWGCSNLESVPSSLPSGVDTLSNTFREATVFNQNISGWVTTQVDYMDGLFQEAEAFNQNISGWDTENVISMAGMFKGAINFNQNISGWDTTSCSNMTEMFNNASDFNQNLSGWCVTLIPVLPTNFAVGSALTLGNFPVWGTCPP